MPTTPNFRSKSSATADNTDTLVIATPAGAVAGDILVLIVASNSSTSITSPGFTTRQENTTTPPRPAVLTKIATGAEGGSITVTQEAFAFSLGAIYAYQGGGNYQTSVLSALQSATTTPTAAAATTTAANECVLQIVFLSGSGDNVVPSGGYTERGEDSRTTAIALTIEVSDIVQVAAGSTGTPAASTTSAHNCFVVTLALAPLGSSTTKSTPGAVVAAIAQARNAERKASQEHGRPPEPGRPPETGRRTRLDYLHKRGRP